MNLTPNMRTLLTALLDEMRRLEAIGDSPPPGIDHEQWRALWQERREYEACGVRHDLDRWLGYPPTRSDSAVFSRTLRQMEDMGLLVRVNRWGPSSRATHVRLTPLGRAEAERLVREQEAALARFLADAAAVLGDHAGAPDTAALERQLKEVDTTVKAITASIDPANLPLLNERLTQLRQRKEGLERELEMALSLDARPEEAALRRWARERIEGLADAMNGRRDAKVRDVLACYVERIVVTPSTKSGVLAVNTGACGKPTTSNPCGRKKNDRPRERSCVKVIAGAGFEPATSGL